MVCQLDSSAAGHVLGWHSVIECTITCSLRQSQFHSVSFSCIGNDANRRCNDTCVVSFPQDLAPACARTSHKLRTLHILRTPVSQLPTLYCCYNHTEDCTLCLWRQGAVGDLNILQTRPLSVSVNKCNFTIAQQDSPVTLLR